MGLGNYKHSLEINLRVLILETKKLSDFLR